MAPKPFYLTTVFFHMEGTLARTDERRLKSAVGCPDATPLPEFIRSIRDMACRQSVLADLDRREQAAAAKWPLHPTVPRIFAALRSKDVNVAVFSRHGKKAVELFLKRRFPLPDRRVRLCISRDELLGIGRRHNPFRMAAKMMHSSPARFLVVSADPVVLDLAAAAGAVTVRVGGLSLAPKLSPTVHFQIADLGRLTRIIRSGLPLPPGKLPNELLKEFLEEFTFEDPSLLINPGVGEDIAAVDVSADEVLVLKSDPITFATDAVGQYAVLVNANDIATAGASPRWLLTTLLFPIGATPSLIWSVVHELREFCRPWGITLCGGHTEITDAVSRPVVCGMMAGSVRKRNLIDKRRMRPGDRILMTKAAAVEGTALIAREFAPRLRALGLSAGEVRSGRAYLDRISILPEARQAAQCAGVSAMHDVTEGGVATALEELSAAGGCRLRVNLDRIPVYSETRKICRLLGVHPLGLIGSGSLLICCRPKYARRLEEDLRRAGIQATAIGEVAEKGLGVQGYRKGRPSRWPRFEADEIARLFSRSKRLSRRKAG